MGEPPDGELVMPDQGAEYVELEPDDEPIAFLTEELSFSDAENVINQLWFAPLISIDFSPSVTRISLPNGYSEKFYNQINIPSRKYATRSYINQQNMTIQSATNNRGSFAVSGKSQT